MESLAKRVKIDMSQESAADIDEEKSVFDTIPDEVLEIIIKYVPCKKACFLVNKRFYREANNATRNCRLVLDKHSIKDVESIIQTQRKFDELRLNFFGAPSKYIVKVFEQFGPQIKKCVMKIGTNSESKVLMLLGLLRNLEELKLDFRIRNQNPEIGPIPKSEVIGIQHLRSLNVRGYFYMSFLKSLNCPSLEKLVLINANRGLHTSKFIQRHPHLQHLTIKRATSVDIQNILTVDGLRLKTLEIWSLSGSAIDGASILGSSLIHQKQLEILKLPNMFLNSNEVNHSITKLTNLRTLLWYRREKINGHYGRKFPIQKINSETQELIQFQM